MQAVEIRFSSDDSIAGAGIADDSGSGKLYSQVACRFKQVHGVATVFPVHQVSGAGQRNRETRARRCGVTSAMAKGEDSLLPASGPVPDWWLPAGKLLEIGGGSCATIDRRFEHELKKSA